MVSGHSLLPESIKTDVSNWQSAMDEMIDRGMARVRRSREQLIAQGFYDEHGNRLTAEIPYDMRPGSGCDVGG